VSRRRLLVLALAAPLLAWRLDRPGFSDTEGMFAEPAREMVLTGDWVTPRMHGEPFLTKPPLMYWLPAALFALAGPTEYARLWPALAALGTLAATGALGAALFGEAAGVAATVVLATSAGFFVEARLLRADMVLVLAVTLALYCYVRLRRGGGFVAAAAFWATMGVGLLDKGFLAILLPGGIIAVAELMEGELHPRALISRLRALHTLPGLCLVAALALPWHVLGSARNPGFLWDYVVNQHLLFFFDRKLPRDSIPDSLAFFWTMFFVRSLPWSLLVPAAAVHAYRAAHSDRGPADPLRLLAAWFAVVLGFFSLAASRLEHYSLPALPAVALLIGFLVAQAAEARLQVGRWWLVAPPAAAALLALCLTARDPGSLITAIDPMLTGYGLEELVRPTAAAAGAGLLTVALLLAARRERLAVATVAATAVALLAVVQIAHERVEALFSWRPFARIIERTANPGARIFFRASDEYQLCGGLEYYGVRRLELLAPPGWVPPTFLAGRTDRLFTPAAELERAWGHGSAFLVSDDVGAPGDESRLVPGPYTLLARAGSRVLLRAGAAEAGPHGRPPPAAHS